MREIVRENERRNLETDKYKLKNERPWEKSKNGGNEDKKRMCER